MTMQAEIFLAGAAVAMVASAFGVFIVLRKMALTVDAMTHVALPGLALGILYHFNPFVGGFAFLLAGVFLVFFIEERTTLATETTIGILFTAGLAIGAFLIPEESLVEALFGDITKLTVFDVWILIGGSVLATFLVFRFFRQFSRTAFSQELASAEGVETKRFYVLYLLVLAFLVALGIKLVGTLLMGALVVLPAATAKNFARSLTHMVFWSMAIGISAFSLGFLVANQFAVSPGPAITLALVVFFLVSLLPSKR